MEIYNKFVKHLRFGTDINPKISIFPIIPGNDIVYITVYNKDKNNETDKKTLGVNYI